MNYSYNVNHELEKEAEGYHMLNIERVISSCLPVLTFFYENQENMIQDCTTMEISPLIIYHLFDTIEFNVSNFINF
ncbi:hypothetical protein HZS_1851 [Henneguya salminicola]|nr:hypothetical protein HZS_1851 [Henneguya salminicola]